jgi:hypothetical protein
VKPAAAIRLLLAELRSLLPARGRVFDEVSEPGASLRYRGPVPVLTLTGEPRDMGRQQGRLLSGPIRALKEAYLDRFLATFAGKARERGDLVELSHRLASHLPERHREELEGLAEGAGLTPDDALLTQTFLDLHKLFFCSTIVGRSPSGHLLFGRNLDFPSLGVVHRFGLVVVHRGEGLHPLASVSWPGLLGVLSGMNDEGLALAVMVVYFAEDARDGIPYTLLFRRLLEEERDLAGVERRLDESVHTNSNNLMAVAGDREAAVFEIRPSGVERLPFDRGILCSTNHFRGRGRGRILLHPLSISSHYRLRRLDALAPGAEDRISIARVRRALRLVARPLGNLQSMIFAPGERELRLAMGRVPAARGTFTLLSREALFGGHSGNES